jgi:hypothetical protein
MNPRRVHELMRRHFPEVRASAREWVVAADANGLRVGVLEGLVEKYISGEDLFVEVSRRLGDFLPVRAALELAAMHVGQGEIRLSNQKFTGFVVIATNGAATGWSEIEQDASAESRIAAD